MKYKAEKKYGVFVNIHPSGKDKRVTLHKLPCSHYKQHLKRGKASNIYTFHKDCSTFEDAVNKASEWSLYWHAALKICKGCRVNWNLP